MIQQHHDREGRQGIPLSAVYRQLDDQPAAGAEGYDPAATVARLMTRWAGSSTAEQRSDDAPSAAPEKASAMHPVRHELVLRLSQRRLASAVWAYAAIVGISGIAAAVAVLVTHLPAMVLTGLALTAVLVAYAVVLIHRATMHGMTADRGLLLGRDTTAGKETENPAIRALRPHLPAPIAAETREEDEGIWPDNRHYRPKKRPRSRGRSIWAVLAAPVLALIAYASLHAGAVSLITLVATAGGAVLTLLILVAIAMFASEPQSRRVFRLLALLQGHQDAAEITVSRARGEEEGEASPPRWPGTHP